MKPSKILAICKYSKLEYDKKIFNLDTYALLQKYKDEHIHYEIIIDSHVEQRKCIDLAKQLLPEATFLYTDQLKMDMTNDYDLIVSIGGDEHFKYVIHNSIQGKLVLNIRSDNLKSEGALSSCNRLNLKEMVDQIRSDNFLIEEWVRLEAELNGKPIESAIDTIYIGEANATRMSRYLLHYQNQTEEQKSSGLLIVTGAGSTGWFSSAGGESFPRNSQTGRFLAREIYKGTVSGYNLNIGEFHPNEEIKVLSLIDSRGIVEIDSIKEYPFKRGSQLRAYVSDKCLRVVTLNPNPK